MTGAAITNHIKAISENHLNAMNPHDTLRCIDVTLVNFTIEVSHQSFLSATQATVSRRDIIARFGLNTIKPVLQKRDGLVCQTQMVPA
jgi:hypothetical protein